MQIVVQKGIIATYQKFAVFRLFSPAEPGQTADRIWKRKQMMTIYSYEAQYDRRFRDL